MVWRACASVFALLALLTLGPAAADAERLRRHRRSRNRANPLRKVITLLEKMQGKAREQAEKEKALHDKFMCSCKTQGEELANNVQAANDKLPTLTAEIKKTMEQEAQAKDDLKQAQVDRVAAKNAIAESTEIRKKDSESFTAEKAECEANVATIDRAVQAIERGMGGSFLQSAGAQALIKLATNDKQMLEEDRQAVMSFMSGTTVDGENEPSSGEVVGIMKQMRDFMSASLQDTIATENNAVKEYDNLVAAKEKELGALQRAIEQKLKQAGELSVRVAQMKNDKDDTKDTLAADEAMSAELSKTCKQRALDYEAEAKAASEELVALSDTVKLLNDDSAADMMKSSTLGSAAAGSSLLQIQVTSDEVRNDALEVLRSGRDGPSAKKGGQRLHLDLVTLALHGKKGGFDEVIAMVDDMMGSLQAEQQDDDNKKSYCAKQFDESDDTKKLLTKAKFDHKKAMATTEESIANTAEDIAQIQASIKTLDTDTAVATKQRQEENAEFKDLMASNGAAKELLGMAVNRLQKFYNPSLAKLVQINKQESAGALEMLRLLIADLEKEMTIAKAEEKNAQADYEAVTESSSRKRSADTKQLTQTESVKAQLEERLEAQTEAKDDASKELAATNDFINTLHLECDFLVKYFDIRKQARTEEMDALGKAKDVLNGADYSFVQVRRTTKRRSLRRGAA